MVVVVAEDGKTLQLKQQRDLSIYPGKIALGIADIVYVFAKSFLKLGQGPVLWQ